MLCCLHTMWLPGRYVRMMHAPSFPLSVLQHRNLRSSMYVCHIIYETILAWLHWLRVAKRAARFLLCITATHPPRRRLAYCGLPNHLARITIPAKLLLYLTTYITVQHDAASTWHLYLNTLLMCWYVGYHTGVQYASCLLVILLRFLVLLLWQTY